MNLYTDGSHWLRQTILISCLNDSAIKQNQWSMRFIWVSEAMLYCIQFVQHEGRTQQMMNRSIRLTGRVYVDRRWCLFPVVTDKQIYAISVWLLLHRNYRPRWRHQLKHFPRYWPFVRGIYRWPVNSPHKCQWRGALLFSLVCACINAWVHNREVGDLKCHRAHYDVSVRVYVIMVSSVI